MKILESFVASPFAGAVGWALLHSLWEGAGIAALLATVVLGTRSARIRYGAACVAMVAMVVAFGVTIYRLMPESAQNFPRFRSVAPFAMPPNVAPQGDRGSSWLAILSMLAPWLAPFWITGVFLLSLQRVMSCVAVRRMRSRGVCFASEEWHGELARLATQLRVSRPVHLLESCFAEIPMVLGHLRPVILMPIGLLANLPAEQVETILLHELAHIRRCDYLVNALQRIVESVLFYHPAIWWISKVMRTERENCCDDVVVSVSQHANEYARALAALERNRLPRPAAAVAATGGTLVKRIRRLLYPKAPAGIWAPIAATAIFVVTAAVSFAAWQPKMAQPTPARAQTEALDAENMQVKTFYLANSETPERMDAIVTALRQVLGPQSVQAVYARKAIIVRDSPEKLSVAGKIIDVEDNQTISSNPAVASDNAARLRLQVKTQENLAAQNRLAEVQELRNAIVQENVATNVTPSGAPQLEPLSRAPISLTATEDSRVIYETIASLAGVNVEFDPSFTSRRIKVDFSGVSLKQALDAVSMESGNKWTAVASDKFLVAANAALTQTAIEHQRPETIDYRQASGRGGSLDITAPDTYSKWVNEDVVYIITDEERDTFLHLNSDEEREKFIEAFWGRRNPTPGAADNKFKDEYYRRIAYSNEHFGTPSGKLGWQTDRGHIYIVYGAPNVYSESSAGQNGSQSATERWFYHHVEGVGDNLLFEFVDRGGHGDFVLVPSPSSQINPKAGASNAVITANENLYRGNPADNSSLRRQSVSAGHVHDAMFVQSPSSPQTQVAPKSGASHASTEKDEYAKDGLTILSPTEGVDFGPYIKDMLKSIQTHWYNVMPQEAKTGQASGQVSVIFRIQPDGKLDESQIASSSGASSLDAAAMEAVRGAAPLQPLPKEFHGPSLRLKLTFAYNQPLHN